jgi:hypothetical protein
VGKRTDWMVLFYVGCISIVDILGPASVILETPTFAVNGELHVPTTAHGLA